MILPIYTYNHPVLKQKAAAIETIDDLVMGLISDMFDTMYRANGIGLAANQVGKGLAVTVIDASDSEDADTSAKLVMINPVIEAYSEEEEEFEEGCLSLPSLNDTVIRPRAIQVRFYDENMVEHVREVDGLLARVMQHEIDHLNGMYFFERLSPIRRTLANGKLKKIARGLIETDYPLFASESSTP